MRRRALLTTLATTGTVAIVGCSAESDEPEPTPIGDIEPTYASYELEYDRFSKTSVTIGGTVVKESAIGVMLADGTGIAEVSPRESNKMIDDSTVSLGDCLTVTGPVNVKRSESHEMPAVEGTSFDRGGDCPDIEPLPEVPRPEFDGDWDGESEESVFRRVGGDDIGSSTLVVRWRESGDDKTPWSESERAPWHELADVAPDETIPVDSEIRFDGAGIQVGLLWESPDRPWSQAVKRLTIPQIAARY